MPSRSRGLRDRERTPTSIVLPYPRRGGCGLHTHPNQTDRITWTSPGIVDTGFKLLVRRRRKPRVQSRDGLA